MELPALERKQSKCGAQPIPGALFRISGTALVVSIRGDGLWVVVTGTIRRNIEDWPCALG